jgi:hypothetical protein
MSVQRFCERCGAPLLPDASFCEQCGAPRTRSRAADVPRAASPEARWSRSGLVVAGIVAGLALLTAAFVVLSRQGLPVGLPGNATATSGITLTVIPATPPPTLPAILAISPSPLMSPIPQPGSSPAAASPAVSPSPRPPASPTAARPSPSATAELRTILPPPPLGPTVFADPLTASGVFGRGACPTGLIATDFTEEGYRVSVRGPCTEQSTAPFVMAPARGLSISDGEVRVDARAIVGAERASYFLAGRVDAGDGTGYLARFEPTVPFVSLIRWDAAGSGAQPMVREADASILHFVDGWNTVALRFRGSRMWVLLNGTPVIYADDSAYADGGIELGAGRTGELRDTVEATTVFRNLEIRALVEQVSWGTQSGR